MAVEKLFINSLSMRIWVFPLGTVDVFSTLSKFEDIIGVQIY